jgi:hypothetical protein
MAEWNTNDAEFDYDPLLYSGGVRRLVRALNNWHRQAKTSRSPKEFELDVVSRSLAVEGSRKLRAGSDGVSV